MTDATRGVLGLTDDGALVGAGDLPFARGAE